VGVKYENITQNGGRKNGEFTKAIWEEFRIVLHLIMC